jgi:hypothetical protein
MAQAWHYLNQPLDVTEGWTDSEGTSYAANWVVWSDERKEKAGLELMEVLDPRFYNITTRVAKDIDEAKAEEIGKVEVARREILEQTRFAVIDAELYGNPMPYETSVARRQTNEAADATVAKIQSASSIEELEGFYAEPVMVLGIEMPNVEKNWGMEGQGLVKEPVPTPELIATQA